MTHASDPADDWSPPRIVDPRAPAPIVLGEMAEVRRTWRRQRRERLGRRVWPALVALLLAVIVTAVVLLGILLEF
ncbi:hypothetical protein ACXR2U_17865 [Jatrophihabitans sp. YIM 134969]